MRQMIKIEVVDTPSEKFVDCEPFVLTLEEKYISFLQQGTLSKDGEEDFFLNEITFDKDKVSGIEILYHQFNNQYQVFVYCMGVSSDSDIKMFFNDIQKAQKVYFAIQDWKFKP